MKQKIFLIIFILLALLFPAADFVSAQVAAPPQTPAGPLLTSVVPSSGEQGQTLELIISGQNFQNGARVSFNPAEGISVISTEFITATEIRANITIASDAPLLSRDVIITNPNQPTGTFKQGFTVRPAADRAPPPPIIGLTATDALDGKIDLTWIPSSAEDFGYYALYWNETVFINVTGLTPAAKISDRATNTYQTTGLTDGTKYYFAVTAVDKSGNEDKNVLTANATPTPSAVPPVTIPFPTAPAPSTTPTPTASVPTSEPTPTGLPAGLIPLIILAALAAFGGLIYSIKKYQSKKSLEDKKAEIKKEESFRFLNKDSKLTKLEIQVGAGKTVDLVQEIMKLWKNPGETKAQLETILGAPPEYETTGIPIDLALKIFDTQKDALQKILGGPIPAEELKTLGYTITIEPVSGVDIEWQIAEVSLGGQLQPLNKFKIKEAGDEYTYAKHVKVMKTDVEWKKYMDDQKPEFADLKKIIQVHLDELGRQEEKYKHL